MHDILTKLWTSKGTIAILVWIAVFAWAYNLDWSKKLTVKKEISYRTVEEIMATTVDKTTPPEWDSEFRSSIEAVK